jgi:hypothetical protein
MTVARKPRWRVEAIRCPSCARQLAESGSVSGRVGASVG